MDKKITYHEQTSRENTLKLRSVLQTLPDFTKDFFRAIEPNTSAKTRISYVYDIRLFFQFLQINNPVFAKKDSIKDIRLEDLEQLQPSPFFCKHESGYGESEMMEVFHKIPKLYAEVLILRYVNELGVSEIAELLNIKQNTVSKRIARGIAIIRKEWLGNE